MLGLGIVLNLVGNSTGNQDLAVASLAVIGAGLILHIAGIVVRGQTIRKNAATENVLLRFDFNQDMSGDTLITSEFTLTKADGTPTGLPLPAAGTGTASTVTLNMGALPAGTYKFTLKANATINDRHLTPVEYKQAADRVFTFVVSVDPPPPFSCLGAP
jgi:hypothetical protein